MGRPKTQKLKRGQRFHLSFYIDGALVQEIDDQAEVMTQQSTVSVTRTDVIRIALRDWIERRKAQ